LIVQDIINSGEHSCCPNCGCEILIFDADSGESSCSRCGLVIEEGSIDLGPEWSTHFIPEKNDRSRAGIPMSNLYYDKGLSTVFNPNDIKACSPEERSRMWRLKKWNVRSKLEESKMKNLNMALSELDMVADILHVPNSVKEHSAEIYRKALSKDLIRGRSISDFVAASIYAACRDAKVPRSLREVSKVSTQDVKSISRTYRLLINELEIKVPIDYPMKFIPKIASKVGVCRETELLCYEILGRAKKEKVLTGKDPRGVAAAALYMACKAKGDKGTQKSVSEAAGTSEVTLRSRLRELEELFQDENEPKTDYNQLLEGLTVQAIH
jgi:transcription initiation factor TFIIB